MLSGTGEVLLIHWGWWWVTFGSAPAQPAGSVEGGSGGLSVRLKAALNMLSLTGSWRQPPWDVPHCQPPSRRVRGSSCSGRDRDVLLSFPCTSMASGGREGGQRAAYSLPLPSSTHSRACIPLLQAPLGAKRDRATPTPDGEGQLG